MALQDRLVQSFRNVQSEYKSASPEERAEIAGRAIGLAVAIGIPAWAGFELGKSSADYFHLLKPAKILTEVGSATGLVMLLTPMFGPNVKDAVGGFFNSAASKYIDFKEYLSSMRVDRTDRE